MTVARTFDVYGESGNVLETDIGDFGLVVSIGHTMPGSTTLDFGPSISLSVDQATQFAKVILNTLTERNQ